MSVYLYFPANFLVVSYSCFKFLWGLDWVILCFFGHTCCFCCSFSAALHFPSFLTSTVLIMSTEIHSLCCYFLFPSTSMHVLIHISLILCCRCLSMSMYPSSKASYLFLTVSQKVSVVIPCPLGSPHCSGVSLDSSLLQLHRHSGQH